MACKHIITIGRQFGSGGREIGNALAEILGVKCYDRELISLAAKESGVDSAVFENVDEVAVNSLLYSLSLGINPTGTAMELLPTNDRLYVVQHRIIEKIAEEGGCIFVGRCADHILRNKENLVKVFICADKEYRVQRAIEKKGVKSSKAEQIVHKTDKTRASYYNFYSGKKWGQTENYDLCINRTKLTDEQAARVILGYLDVL